MDDSGSDDSELMRATCAGDAGAFADLVRRHQDRLWLTAWCILRNTDDAKDAVQDGLVRALRLAPTWRGDGSVASWMHQIVTRAALDRATRKSKRRTYPLEDVAPAVTATRDNTADTVEEQVVQAVVAALPPDQRECFVRIDILGFTFAEVAADLGVPLGTVKSRRARGKARVVEALRDAGLVGPNRGLSQSSSAGVVPEAPQQRSGPSAPYRRAAT